MKKIIAFTLLLMMALTSAFAFAESTPLQFKEDGSFKIMVLSDTHIGSYNGTLMSDSLKEYFNRVFAENVPDLIILLGDNISADNGEDIAAATVYIDDLMSFLDPLGIPVASVFGNHDGEVPPECPSKYEQLAVYQKYDCFVGELGMSVNNCVSNYNLPILSSDGSRYAFNLWFFDNGALSAENKAEGGNASAVESEVVNWYVETSNALKEANGGQALPSFVFQHIVMREIESALIRDESAKAGWQMAEDASGTLGESPCPWYDTSEQFAAFLQQGDVVAIFSGHDHRNNFIVPYQGIDICNVPIWTKLGSYSAPKIRGIYFIDLNENDIPNYTTYCIRPEDLGETWYYGKVNMNSFTLQ